MSSRLITVGVFVALVLLLGVILFIDSSNNKLSEATGLVVSIESFPTYLETHPVFKSLPNGAFIEVVIGENNYEISDSGVYLTNELFDKKDVSVYLPGEYLSRIGELGLCSAIKEANKNGDLNVEIYTSKLNLLLKYRKLLKYRNCLGG
ncbi:MAG: hypothetical protein AABX96_02655 [Nanoarchaeota archaeon]